MRKPREESPDNELDIRAIVKAGIGNSALGGVFMDTDGQVKLDRRYTAEAVEANPVLTPRTADLNLIGAEFVPVSRKIALRLGFDVPPADSQV